jgi:hypothetical protein
MTRDPLAVSEDDSLETVVELMERRHIKRLPVLRGREIVGIVSRSDLMRALVGLARSEEAPAGGDPAIRELIVAAFAKQPWAPHVNIVVKDAVAELWGTITDERERQALRGHRRECRRRAGCARSSGLDRADIGHVLSLARGRGRHAHRHHARRHALKNPNAIWQNPQLQVSA